MTTWTLRVVWPVEDPEELAYSDMIRLAKADLAEVARRSGALIVGEPTFKTEETDGEWPDSGLAVVCVVAAVPDHDRWPTVIADLAAQGWSDARIGEVLRCKAERVRGVRRRHGIASGVPRHYRSREQAGVAL